MILKLLLNTRKIWMIFIKILKNTIQIKKAKALNLLLVALCSFTFCSLLVCFFPLPVTFCLLLITFFSLLIIFLSKWPWNKMTLNRKKWLDYNETPSQIFSLQISEILITFPGSWFSKFSQHVKPFSMLT